MQHIRALPRLCLVGFVIIAAAVETLGGEARPPPAIKLDGSGNARLAPAMQMINQGDYARACADLDAVVEAAPTDAHARVWYAIALLGAERREQARQQASIAICWKPGLVQAYTVRAIAAARMGSVARARDDLKIVRQLDPGDAVQLRGATEKRVEELLRSLPEATAVALHAALLKAARDGESLTQLIGRAADLLKSSNAMRLYGDESYSERCRQLIWSLTHEPKSPDRIAACANFLLDEIELRSDPVESAQHPTYYRLQGAALRDAELDLARRMLVSARTLDPSHVPTLAGLARIEFRAQLWANAEKYLRQAIATGKADRQVLWMMRDIMQVAAAQNIVESIKLRTVRRWDEKFGNYVYEYASYPTAAELARADAHDANASNLLYQSRDYLRRAIQTLSDDAASHDFVACMAFRVKDWAAARLSWEKAVKLDPAERAYRYSLSNAYSRLNLVDGFMEQATTGRNLEHTTAATQVRMAWRLILAGNWTEAARQIEDAVKVDAGDPRTIACMAVIAEARGQAGEALALYRAAFALEEAHAQQRGCSWQTGAGRWYVNDLGRAVELRARMAELTEGRDPQTAAQLYLDNAKLESLIGDGALKQEVFTAMLPLPNLPANRRQDAPRFGELMRTNRANGAVMLVKLGKHQAAAEHFRKLQDYDVRNRAAGAKAYEVLRDETWKSARTASAAVECFQRIGDAQDLYGWRIWMDRADRSHTDVRWVPTSPQPAGGTRH